MKQPGEEGSVTDEPYTTMTEFDMSAEAIDVHGNADKNKKRKR